MPFENLFSTTYEGSRQALGTFGEALQSTAAQFAKKKEEQMKREQAMNFMKQFGILKDKEPTLQDYETTAKDYSKQTGKELILKKNLPESEQLKTIKTMFDLVGLPHPESKGMEFDYEKASKAGIQYNMSTGEMVLAPKKQEKTLLEQITEAEYAKEKGLEYAGGKVKTSAGGLLEGKRKDAIKIGDAIIAGTQPPELTRLYGLSGPVRAHLADKGYDLTRAQTDWIATSNYVKNLNSTQQVRLGQALTSVKSSIEPLRELSDNFKRANLTPVNWVQLQVAMKSGDPTATKIVDQINLMRDELAQAFMAGGVPTERALELVKEILQPVYGDQQMDAALDQLQFNLNIRENAINAMRPRTIGGELETGRPMSSIKGVTDIAGLKGEQDMITIKNKKTGETKQIPRSEVSKYAK